MRFSAYKPQATYLICIGIVTAIIPVAALLIGRIAA